MFGYVRPCKQKLSPRDYRLFMSFYCGLCKRLSRYGAIYRILLPFDLVFPVLVSFGLHSGRFVSRRCPVYPLQRRRCAEGKAINLCSSAAVLLINAKIRDEISDSPLWLKPAFRFAGLLSSRGHRLADRELPSLSKFIDSRLTAQTEIERKKSPIPDEAAHPSAEITGAVCSLLSESAVLKPVLFRFGYCMGRFVYLTDALADAQKDFTRDCYNPYLIGKSGNESLETIRTEALADIYMTLGELISVYRRIPVENAIVAPLLENIIFTGLSQSCSRVGTEKEKINGQPL